MKKSVLFMKKRLVASIEAYLDWGTGDTWTNKDFNELSERILKATGKRLSVTTLKRVWGRAETVANPSVSTFDILSEFLGYGDWRDFQQKNTVPNGKINPLIPNHLILWGSGIVVLILVMLLFWNNISVDQKQSVPPKAFSSREDVAFSLEKVSSGYPNTVIFNYDVGDMPYDSLCIQQYWDKSKRISLKESKGLVTSTYYLPGYFLAKLIADDRILKEYELYIPTEGWQSALLGKKGKITYLDAKDLYSKDVLTVQPDVLSRLNNGGNDMLHLAHLSPVPEIDGQNFILDTRFRMPSPSEESICQYIRMVVTGTREVVSLSFSIPGCVGDLNFFIDQEMVSGRNHDFSAFGREAEQWTQCRLEVLNGELTVFLNGKEAYKRLLQVDLGKIGGVQWYFEGLGEISALSLEDDQHQLDLMP